jgi:molybdopterin molybdotransferase
MISVEDSLTRVTGAFSPLPGERVSLAEALGRVLDEDVHAAVSHPPANVSAMDGYAVRAGDVAQIPAALTVVGEASAGRSYENKVEPGQAVRIFTGGTVPQGADAIIIQENTKRDSDTVTVMKEAGVGTYIRRQGLDFEAGELGLKAGRRLVPRDIAFAAAMNLSHLKVRRKPHIAVLSTGDELIRPGETPGPNQIPGSNGPALAAFVDSCGGEPVDLGIAPDDKKALAVMAAMAKDSDLLVTSGGVSVGDHDITHDALGECGLEVDFWGVAMRPGKPLLFGHLSGVPFLGFPGNPVSTLVCAVVYLRPAIDAMLGVGNKEFKETTAQLACDLDANDARQDYLRVRLARDEEGSLTASPFSKQDSSMISILSQADGLLIRPPHAPAIKAGARATVIPLGRR